MTRALSLLLLGACVKAVPLPAAAELHRAKTDDGLSLALVRYPAQGVRQGRPVLLCHGISANDRNMDLDEGHSLARWLAAHGREAWTMSLRGTGASDRPAKATFDDLWQRDLPAAIEEVRRTSHADAVDFVGHSMGGMLAYAYLAEGGQGIHALATLGSPTTLDFGLRAQPLLDGIGRRLPLAIALPSALGAGLLAPFASGGEGPVQLLLYNPENVEPETWSRLLGYGTANILGGVARQITALARGEFKSFDGALDFRKDMAKVRVPVLVVAGRLDRTAPTPGVKDGYRCLGGPKEWLLVSQANGAKAEYGHMDLVVGQRAGVEVWPKVLDFFDRHDKELLK